MRLRTLLKALRDTLVMWIIIILFDRISFTKHFFWVLLNIMGMIKLLHSDMISEKGKAPVQSVYMTCHFAGWSVSSNVKYGMALDITSNKSSSPCKDNCDVPSKKTMY